MQHAAHDMQHATRNMHLLRCRFECETQQWTPFASMASKRQGLGSAILNGKIYAVRPRAPARRCAAPPTSAPRPGSPRPHLHRDWVGRTPTSAPGLPPLAGRRLRRPTEPRDRREAPPRPARAFAPPVARLRLPLRRCRSSVSCAALGRAAMCAFGRSDPHRPRMCERFRVVRCTAHSALRPPPRPHCGR